MLKLTVGGFSSVAYGEFKNEILRLVGDGKRVFLLVPEQQAVVAEREIMELLPPSAPLCFEVTNFTRLANTVYRQVGGIADEYADGAKEALIMWRTLTELSPFLDMTGGKDVGAGLVEKALAAVAEMKSISALPDELALLSENESIKKTNRRLAAKLADIAKIMSLYNKLLEEKYSSAKDECEKLAKKLEDYPDIFGECSFFITGFTSFTEPQYKVLGALMKNSYLSVHLTLSALTEDFFEFSEIKRTKERLFRTADKVGTEKQLLRREGRAPEKSGLLCETAELLWRNFGEIDNYSLQNSTDALRIFEANDPYEECEFIAADIKRKVMEGAEWRDFAIIARCAEGYAGILDYSLKAAGVPHYISKRTDISSYEAVKLIFTAFEAVNGGFSRQDVITYAKCRLSGISADACDKFELYTDMWQIDKKRFTDEVEWCMSPDGYSTRRRDDGGERLAEINRTRAALIDPLIKLKEGLDEADTVREHATALFSFMTDISLEERIEERCRELLRLGEATAAEENARLFEIICGALDALVDALGDLSIGTAAFLNQLKTVLSEADMGRIPAAYDEVTVGSANMIRLSDKKHVYLLGVNAGEFPASVSESSYFTARDKLLLSRLGLATDTDSQIPYARELFFFSRAFAAASESVTLLYTLHDEAFAASAPSDVIERIKALTKEAVSPVSIGSLSPLEKIYYPRIALNYGENGEVYRALCDVGYADELRVSEGNITNSDLRLGDAVCQRIYADDIALTQTRIDTYVSCPFSYYLRYTVGISENERAEFDARSIGTFIHFILESFFGELNEKGTPASELTAEAKSDAVTSAAKKYLFSTVDKNTVNAKRTDILLDRLCRSAMPIVDGLCNELSDCKYVPRFFELKIEKGNAELPEPATFKSADRKNVYVYGSIDRVDTFELENDVYVRVIDYKTGSKSFSPRDLDEGKNLQMFLYLKAIAESENESFKKRLGVKEGGKIIPAGVIYVNTHLGDVKVKHADWAEEAAEIDKKQKRRGMILNDEVSIAAMNKKYIPVKFNKDGSPAAKTEEFLYTAEEWSHLNRKVSDKVAEISDSIKSGDISLTKKIKDPPCDFCKYSPICRRKTVK